MRMILLAVCYFSVSAVVWADDGVADASIKVRGQVIDAESGKPIDSFKLVVGSPYNDIHTTWQSHLVFEQADGKYQWSVARAWRKTRLRIDAEGYLPGISPLLERRAGAPGNLKINFKLRRNAGLQGMVRNVDGQLVAGAQVALATQTFETIVDEGKLLIDSGEKMGAKVELTDGEGRFRLPPESDAYLIVVADREHGFAVVQQSSVKVGHNIEIKLQPWCRVTVKCVDPDGRRNVGSHYGLSARWRPTEEWPVLQHRNEPMTNDQGGFDFPFVAPGSHQLQMSTSGGRVRGIVQESWRVDAVAGKPVVFDVGTQVRPVQGKLTVATESTAVKFDFDKLKLNIMPQKLLERRLANPRFLGVGNEQVRSGIGVAKSGEFAVKDLPPGRYAVFVDSGDDPAAAGIKFTVNSLLEVPLVDEATSSLPHDVGEVTMFARIVVR